MAPKKQQAQQAQQAQTQQQQAIKPQQQATKLQATTKANFKPGQKYATPAPGDSLAIFYASTYRQKKTKSPMSEKWLLEHGLFKLAAATRIDLRNKMSKLSVAK